METTPLGFHYDFQRISTFPAGAAPLPAPGHIQTKREVGSVNDPLEREAEDAAELITSVPDSDASAGFADGHSSGQPRVHGAATGTSSVAAPAHASVRDALRHPGEPLDSRTQAFFQPRFGFDFSRVRIHSGQEASRSAREIRAQAYTAGWDIVFAEGRYAPHADTGKRLLAHELTHVVQQSRGRGGAPIQRSPDEKAEPTGGGTISATVQSDCPEAKARVLALTVLKCQRILNAALDWWRNSSPESDVTLKALLRSNFGSDSDQIRSAVHERLVKVSAILEVASSGHVDLRCAGPKDAVCSKNEYYAYVKPGTGYRITFCNEFFDMAPEEQLWGMVHETCHVAGALGDHYIFTFGEMDANACFGKDVLLTNPLGNADSYVNFVWCLVKPGTVVHAAVPMVPATGSGEQKVGH